MGDLVWKHFDNLCVQYPGIQIESIGSNVNVYGSIRRKTIYGGVSLGLDFSLRISIPNNYPLKCPKVYSYNDSIPVYFHTNPDNSLCLGAPYEVEKKFRTDPTLCGFVNNLLIPFLYSYQYKKTYQCLPYGERSHGAKGILESYQQILRVQSCREILHFLEIVTSRDYRGHWRCPCNSGMKIRNCHREIIQNMMKDKEFYDFSQDILALRNCE